MRRVAASMASMSMMGGSNAAAGGGSFANGRGDDPSSFYNDASSACMSMGSGGAASAGGASFMHGSSMVGNVLLGGPEGSGVSCVTFEQHSTLVRYPNSMSNLRRLRCYLLACQAHHFSYKDYLGELVPSDVAKALAENPVTIPDPNSLLLCIDSLAMNIRPFDELNQFRTRCFLSFASHQKRGLSLTQVLKLYVCAYQVGFIAACIFKHSISNRCKKKQVKSIWKKLWTSVYPVISPQIIRDVETFVARTPFAVQPFVDILKTSSPF